MLRDGQLLIASSYAMERNGNMPPQYTGRTPWGGLIRIGERGSPPRSSIGESRLAAGFDGRRNYWAWVFQSSAGEAPGRILWMLEDVFSYAAAPASVAVPFELDLTSAGIASASPQEGPSRRPVLLRTSPGTAIVSWRFSAGQWRESHISTKSYINDACYSMVGRPEPGSAWVLYTASRTAVYRIQTTSTVSARTIVSVVRRAQPGMLFRGVALPPLLELAADELPDSVTDFQDVNHTSPPPPMTAPTTLVSSHSRSKKPRQQ